MIAYFDCFSGISGDMTLGALIDLGVPPDWLKESIAALPLSGFDIVVSEVVYNGIRAKRVEVPFHGHHHHRHYSDIRDLIGASPLPERPKQTALAVFKRLAEAEAGVHGCRPEEVHFHEVGAVDAIVDVVGSALGLHRLGIDAVFGAPVPTGRGFVQCSHGRMPVPAPATAALLAGVPVAGSEIEYELTTPTGAAVLTGVASAFGPMPDMTVRAVGYGAGSRNIEPGPNLLRVFVGESDRTGTGDYHRERVAVVEAAVDDMNPEIFGYLMERLFAAGALDVLWVPVHMKKNRPGTLLQALCRREQLSAVARCILQESTSLGVRYHEVDRLTAERDIVQVRTGAFGNVAVKRIRYPDGEVRLVPEYEVCRAIARERGLALRAVYETVIRDAAPDTILPGA
jgi:uncharacterized protein (TIGR00299 family) protein